ncbi:MAG: SH3 domain-containing protein [Candidatus Pelethousia sp.]|nr:SH3 domain-containing protein [Candidatus Pelethousia sp.]
MKKRLLALILCLCSLLVSLPAVAHAAVLPGMNSKVDYDNVDPALYTIDIDLVNQVITVYQTGTGSIVLQSLCTTGDAENATGSGKFALGQMKERFGYFVAYGQYAQYWTQVVRGVYIHSVMYDSKKLTSMSKSAYRNLGSNVSHGCVRVLPHVAQWIYYNCPPGTICNIVKNRAADPGLVSSLKAQIPEYSQYNQPTDSKPDPAEIPATVRFDGTPLRTGFSNSRDTTIATLAAGDHVMLLQLADDWCKVRTASGKLGYVKSPYLLCEPDNVQLTSGYKATAKTYVYGTMDASGERLATIPSGGQPTVYENPKKGWWYGEYNGVAGYMRTKYVQESTVYLFPALPTVAAGVTNADGTTAVVSGTGAFIAQGIIARLRSLPSTDGDVIAGLPAGTPVILFSATGDWYYCQADIYTGYLHKDCLSAQ